MTDPGWLKKIDAREQAATGDLWKRTERLGHEKDEWLIAAFAKGGKRPLTRKLVAKVYAKADADQIIHSRADTPLMRDMLRELAKTLEYIGASIGEVSDKEAARTALAMYRSGKLPTKGEPDGEQTQTG